MFDQKAEFELYFTRLSSAERKKSQILQTIFQQRRKRLPAYVLVQNSVIVEEDFDDEEEEVPMIELPNALSYMGSKDQEYAMPDLEGITMYLFHNVNNQSYDEILNQIAAKFGPDGQDPKVLEYFKHKSISDSNYQRVFSDLKPGDFLKRPPIELNIRDKDNRSQTQRN